MRAVRAVSGAPMVSVAGVTKWFGGVVAVADVSIDLGPGVTALLGPNGAGKSTLLRLLAGLARPSRGVVRIGGHDPRRRPAVMRYVGIVPQQDVVWPRTTARRFVEAAGRLEGVDDPRTAAVRALESVELDPGDDRPLEELSRGMRQRARIAQALVGGPSILVADEPLNGLDPRQRRRMIDLLAALGRQGRCVVISSHVLEEVERFESRVLVLARGRLVADGDVAGIRALMDDRPHRIRIRSDRPSELGAALVARRLVAGVRLDGAGDLEVAAPDVGRLATAVAPLARDLGASIEELVPLDDDLESVFRYLVGAR